MVIGIGELYWRKGIDLILEALSRARPPRPALHWVGNRAIGPYVKQLGERAQELDVRFVPHLAVPQEELTALIKRASFLVYAPVLEPFGYAPLECAAAGLPAVAVAEGGIRETVQDGVTGLLVGRDPDEMAQAITRLLDDPELVAVLGQAAQAQARARWSLDDAVTKLESELERAVALGPKP